MKNTLLFNYSTNILVRLLTVNMKNCLTPKNPKMCDPTSSNSIENTTPSSGTSPLASIKEVLPLGKKETKSDKGKSDKGLS